MKNIKGIAQGGFGHFGTGLQLTLNGRLLGHFEFVPIHGAPKLGKDYLRGGFDASYPKAGAKIAMAHGRGRRRAT